ncbi:hypothetical protein L2X98_24000 [Microbacterium elymi]|uniref:Uncharacterized protein n=1 Tax=Microbacterium elymi TaxID=2909587 RepID=A0ABY5NLR8_9MICO|nr:hypothetical protein [Microbacterium elymi]UUT36132.1 hypothetical protein L2X98_24000 [Microbacterium elymi]
MRDALGVRTVERERIDAGDHELGGVEGEADQRGVGRIQERLELRGRVDAAQAVVVQRQADTRLAGARPYAIPQCTQQPDRVVVERSGHPCRRRGPHNELLATNRGEEADERLRCGDDGVVLARVERHEEGIALLLRRHPGIPEMAREAPHGGSGKELAEARRHHRDSRG